MHRREESGEKLKQSDRKPPSQEKMRSFDELSATMPTGKDSNTAHIVEKHVVDPRSRILSSSNNNKKNLDSYCFVTFYL